MQGATATDLEFTFLDQFDSGLREKIAEAEANATIWPDSSITASRVFVELYLNCIVSRTGARAYREAGDPQENLEKFINRLRDATHLTNTQASDLHFIRMFGNLGAHGNVGRKKKKVTPQDALSVLATVKRLALGLKAGNSSAHARAPITTIAQPNRSVPESNVYPIYSNTRVANVSTPSIPFATSVATPASTTGSRSNDGEEKPRSFLLIAIGTLIITGFISLFAITSLLRPSPPNVQATLLPGQIDPFPTPEGFVISPAGHLAHANVRSAPNTDAEVKEVLARNDQVTGIGRTKDDSGDTWIELAENRGFIKESLLRPVTVDPPQTSANDLLAAAQSYLDAGDNERALEKVKDAQLAPNQSGTDSYRVYQMSAKVALALGDRVSAAQAYIVLAESPALPQSDEIVVLREAIELTYDAKFYQKTIEYAKRLWALGPLGYAVSEKLAVAYYRTENFVQAKEIAQRLVDSAISNGLTPSRDALAIVLNVEQREQPGSSEVNVIVHELCRYYPDDHNC